MKVSAAEYKWAALAPASDEGIEKPVESSDDIRIEPPYLREPWS